MTKTDVLVLLSAFAGAALVAAVLLVYALADDIAHKRRAEDQRVITGIDILAAIPPAVDLAPVHIARSPLLAAGRHRRVTIGDRHRPLWAVGSQDWPTLDLPRPRPAATLPPAQWAELVGAL